MAVAKTGKLAAAIWARMTKVTDVVAAPSMFAEKDALWVNGKEIAHGHGDALDLRLTRGVIREQRERLKADPRVTLRRSGGDWIEVAVRTEEDESFVLELFELAVGAHRADRGEAPKTTPVGEELARRRRLHGSAPARR